MKSSKILIIMFISLIVAVRAAPVFASGDHKHEEDEEEHNQPKSNKNKEEDSHKHGENEEETDEHGHKDGEKEEGAHEEGHKDGDEHGDHEDGPIELTEESQNLGGIKTAKVSKTSHSAKIAVSGRIAQDVEDVKYVFSPEAASIEKCHVALGSNVQKDEMLCVVILNNNNTLEIKSPIAGTVISQFIKEGEHVDETTALYAIADLTKLWANFDVYEKEIASVKLGQKMLVYPLSYPDKILEGEIVFISPRVDESTYTVKIRAQVDNKNYLLKLGMSVRGDILVDDGSSAISIPAEAIQTVENRTVVFKKTDGGFEPQEVKVQSQTKDTASIVQGLKEGDEIAVKGSFILKSKMLESEMGHDHAH